MVDFQRLGNRPQIIEQRAALIEVVAPHSRERKVMGAALQQSAAERLLQTFKPATQGGSGDPGDLGSRAQAAMLGDLIEQLQIIQGGVCFHLWNLSGQFWLFHTIDEINKLGI